MKKSMQGLNFWSFRGIPYAQSPVEELRFQLPQPVKRWNDTLDAFKCGPECPQFNILTRYIVGNRWAHTVDRVSKKLNISESNNTFSVHSIGKFKDFLLKKFFMIFQNGGDMCPDIYVVKTRIFRPVCLVKL